MQMSPKTVNSGRKKPRFRWRTVFAKNLGFDVGFGYRNNTTMYLNMSRFENFTSHISTPALKATEKRDS